MDEVAEIALAEAVAKHRGGEISEAKACYEKIIKEHPQFIAAYHFLGTLFAQQEQFDEAIVIFEKALRLKSDNPHTLNSIANCYKHLRKFDEAEHYYQKAILVEPSYASAYNNLGTLCQLRGKFDQARSYYLQAIKYQPDYPDPHYNLGLIAMQETHWLSGKRHFSQCYLLDREHPKVHLQLGLCYCQLEKPRKALVNFEKQIKIDPNCVESHFQLGNIFHGFFDYPTATQHFERTIALQPNHQEANFNAGVCYLAMNDFARALPHFMYLLQNERAPDVLFKIGIIYMRQDKHQQAITFFKEVLSIDSEHRGANINLANTYLSMKNYAESIKIYKQLLIQEPYNEHFAFTLAGLEQQDQPKQPPAVFVKDLFDHYADHYEKHLQEFLHYNVPKQLFDLFERHFQGSKYPIRILDLGCGTGLCGELFVSITEHIIGIDISPNMIEESREKLCYETLDVMDAMEALKTYPEQDLVIAADLLPYMGDLSKLFAAIRKNLNPEGYFLFSCEKTSNPQDFDLQQSLRYAHNKRYIQACLEVNGFNIVDDCNAVLRQQHNKPLEGHLYLTQISVPA